jgi:hypothetical protein
MSKPSARRMSVAFLAMFATVAFLSSSAVPAQAQQPPQGSAAERGGGPSSEYYVRRAPRGVGGTSLTLSDIWGPAEMPPAPKDFGPHFDFPPEPLNGAPLHDPYPN